MNGTVVEEITKKKSGVVVLGRKKFTATAAKKIKVGKTVEILEIDGTTLKVAEISK